MKISIWLIIVFSTLVQDIVSYIQFRLIRIPHETKIYNYGAVQCLTDLPKKSVEESEQKSDDRLLIGKAKKQQDDQEDNQSQKSNKKKDKQEDDDEDDEEQDEQNDSQQRQKRIKKQQDQRVQDQNNFRQICYEKDIVYAIQLFNQTKESMMMAIDLTVPISWVKGPNCFIAETHRKCSRIQNNYLQQVGKLTKKFKDLFKKPFSKRSKSKKKKQDDNTQALIQGSSQVVKGALQKTKTLKLTTKDSGRLTRFLDVILLGLFIIGINNNLNLQNTTFINALQISPALNYLCDGAISLRFDQNSESSFLKQMVNVAQSQQQSYVTIFIGQHNQSMTIGDLSVKNSAQGLSGVSWIPVFQDDNYGKLPNCHSIQLSSSQSQSHKQIQVKYPLVLTLSSSTITIPKDALQKMLQKFFNKKSCEINQTSRYVQCSKLSSQDIQTKQINFMTNITSIMIPLKQLIIQNKKKHTILNIKSSLDQRFIILGEPFFKRYFVVLDYKNDRIGVSLQRKKFSDALIDVVTLIRFVIWTFLTGIAIHISGCCIIIFLIPMQKCYIIISKKLSEASKQKRVGKRQFGTAQQKRKINTYAPIEQQYAYDDLKGKIQEIVHEEAQGI